ncbi:lipocalin family protein [Danxiaibacter flavus]|nr:lipocalin family protein [Chitinophagaceae bacterium DXS]
MMRKMISKRTVALCLLLVFITLGACTSPSKVTGPEGNAVDLKGNWVVNDINIEGASKGSLKVSVFDEALYSCFIGSQWTLVQNGNGSYTIAANDNCSGAQRKIFWSVQTANGVQYFQFKKLNEGDKAKQVTEGYRLQIKSLQGSTMVLQSAVPFEGKTVYINYNFSKN